MAGEPPSHTRAAVGAEGAGKLAAAAWIATEVADDFNNLLGPMVAYPELVKRQLPAGHPAVHHCDAIIEAARQMIDINSDLMALTPADRFDPEPVDLNRLVREAMHLLPPPPATLSVDLDLAPDLFPVAGNRDRLLRVIANLISNAREAMGDIGVLTLRTENFYADQPFGSPKSLQAGEYVQLQVGDTGPGVAPEIQDRIFDPFFTTKVGALRRRSGLGLSVVQVNVESHNGCLDVESEVGMGTSFNVYLPAQRESQEESTAKALPGGQERLLVVDDDPQQREMMAGFLGRLGYLVDTAADGESALEQLAAHPTDLLILDLVMPEEGSGVELFRRAMEVAPGQRAILTSGSSLPQQIREAQQLGAGAYLRKPLKLDRLARAVRHELRRRQ